MLRCHDVELGPRGFARAAPSVQDSLANHYPTPLVHPPARSASSRRPERSRDALLDGTDAARFTQTGRESRRFAYQLGRKEEAPFIAGSSPRDRPSVRAKYSSA